VWEKNGKKFFSHTFEEIRRPLGRTPCHGIRRRLWAFFELRLEGIALLYELKAIPRFSGNEFLKIECTLGNSLFPKPHQPIR